MLPGLLIKITSRAFSLDVSEVAELITSSTTLCIATSFSPCASKKRYSAEKIVERASIREESIFTFLIPAESCEFNADPVK